MKSVTKSVSVNLGHNLIQCTIFEEMEFLYWNVYDYLMPISLHCDKFWNMQVYILASD